MAGRLHVFVLGSVFFTGKRCWDLCFLIQFFCKAYWNGGSRYWLTTDSLGWGIYFFEHHRRSGGLSSGEEAKR